MISALFKFFTVFMSAIMLFFSNTLGLWKEQNKSLSTVTEVSDGFYTMDYTYDYDIDEMLKYGIPSTVQLVLYGAANTMFDIKGFGCTTFNAVNRSGEYIFARNYDYMDSPYLLIWTHPENGYASISSVSLYFLGFNDKFRPINEAASLLTLLAPYIPVDGMNEKGLCVGVLELETDPTFQISSKPPLTTTTMVRAVLDKCATVDEAIKFFASHDMRDLAFDGCTYHYQLADAKGNTAVIEYVNGKMNVIYPKKHAANEVDYLVAANFYLTPGVDDPLGLGHDRAEKAELALIKSGGLVSEKKAMNILKSVSIKDEDMNGYICSTLWSAVFNTHDLTVDVCVFGDYNHTYSYSLNTPQKLR